MAHMQSPVRVGGPVVEREGLAGVVLAEALVDPSLGPERLDLRLPRLGVGPHAEVGLQQVERVLV